MSFPASLPRRQSCDRCHAQKLRCTRTGDDRTASCTRCVRQGAECVYSSCLPKGRPSMYRSVDPVAGDGRPRRNPQGAATNSDITTASDPGPNPKSLPDQHRTKAPGSASILEGPIDRRSAFPGSIDKSTDMWSGVSPSNWHDLERYDHDMDWSANIFDLIDQHMDVSFAFLDTLPEILPLDHSDMCGPEGECAATGNDNDHSPEAPIAQLSQLSNRLSVLHRWSCTVADNAEWPFWCNHPDQGCQSPLVNDLAFTSVVSWLLHPCADPAPFACTELQPNPNGPSSMEDNFHHVFSTSHQFLEILRCLQGQEDQPMQTSNSHRNQDRSRDSPPQTSPPFIVTERILLATQQPGENPYSRVAERHLVIACHTLLLDIYVTMLGFLQRDIDHRSSCPDPASVAQDAAVGAASLADMRLVLVVQLCSYILSRQYQALSSYLSPKLEPGQPGQLDTSGPSKSTEAHDLNTGPDSEVQRRLERLRASLRI